MQVQFDFKNLITRRGLAVLLSEFLGTLLLALFVGLVAIQVNVGSAGAGESLRPVYQLLSVFGPFFIGAGLAFLVYIFGTYGSAHFNPAVSLAAFIRGDISLKRFIGNWIAQFAGAYFGFLAVKAIFSDELYRYGTFQAITDNLDQLKLTNVTVAALEAIGAALLCLAVLAAMRNRINSKVAPMVIGMALALGIFIAQPFTTGVLNPALSLAMGLPAVYWFAPLLGGVVAAIILIILDVLMMKPNKVAKAEKSDKDKK